jgi:hypothetical protein
MKTGTNKTLRIALPLAAVVLVLVFAAPFALNARRPGPACLLCHQMREAYQTWRLSTHKDVTCDKCHYQAPSGRKMISAALTRSSAAGKKPAVSRGCISCHEDLSDVVKIENLEFPHKDHQQASSCETCHMLVTHGKRVEYSLPESRKKCYDCHKPHTINPHSGNWLNVHRVKGRKGTRECQACHSFQSCADCHGIMEEHKEDWYDGHRIMAAESAPVCSRCHAQDFCASCHDGFTLHEKGWNKKHRTGAEAVQHQDCSSCHTEKYCNDCHEGKSKLHHEGNWLSRHGAEINARDAGKGGDLETCIECHQPGFCLSCHKGLNARIHSSDFNEMHTNVKRDAMPTCLKCHTRDSCNTCHSDNLPATHKPADAWKKQHGISAIRNMDSCSMCHADEFCESCHKHKLPLSHQQADWGAQHAQGSRDKDRNCSLCHEDQYCNACHKRTRPPDHYMKQWNDTHGQVATYDMSNCFVCHVNADCRRCHEQGKTHKAAGWMLEHNTANQSFKSCTSCHELDACVRCHSDMKLKGHAVCGNCHESLQRPSKLKPEACYSCHKSTAGSDMHKAHGGLACQGCHLPHTWHQLPAKCLSCHASINAEHTMDMDCSECHSFK